MIEALMVSPRRRQVIIAGLASSVLPALTFAAPQEKLILSGRILDRDGKPLAGAMVAAGAAEVAADADGRFMLVLDTRAYRGVTCDGRPVEGFVSNRRRDADGTWRATVGLTVA